MKKVSSILLIILGMIHMGAQLSFFFAPEEPSIVTEMRNFKIELFGTHNLFKFHLGFSWMTGLFILFMGFVMLLSRDNNSMKWNLFQLISLTLATVVSVTYFHALANGFLIASLIIFAYTFFKSQKSIS